MKFSYPFQTNLLYVAQERTTFFLKKEACHTVIGYKMHKQQENA